MNSSYESPRRASGTACRRRSVELPCLAFANAAYSRLAPSRLRQTEPRPRASASLSSSLHSFKYYSRTVEIAFKRNLQSVLHEVCAAEFRLFVLQFSVDALKLVQGLRI